MKASVFKNSNDSEDQHSKVLEKAFRSGFTQMNFANHYKKGEKLGFENFKPLLKNHFHEDHFKLYV